MNVLVTENRNYVKRFFEYDFTEERTGALLVKISIPDTSILDNPEKLQEIAKAIASVFNRPSRAVLDSGAN